MSIEDFERDMYLHYRIEERFSDIHNYSGNGTDV